MTVNEDRVESGEITLGVVGETTGEGLEGNGMFCVDGRFRFALDPERIFGLMAGRWTS